MIALRPLTLTDVPCLDRLQHITYAPDFHEDSTVFADRIACHPGGCQGVFNDAAGMVGYLLSHPASTAALPGLNQLLPDTDTVPDCYFIHDIAVHPAYRRQGIATQLLHHAITEARQAGFVRLALVAVQDSHSLWQQHGFVIVAACPDYGDGAWYMERVNNQATAPLPPFRCT
jgi:GNAT superfamily N-acetyltransferase